MKKRITILMTLMGALVVSPVFAATYPSFGGIELTSTTTAAQYIVYFFNLAIAVGAFIAGAVLFMAGVDYVSSRGEPARLSDAKNKIKNAFLGLTILLASFMILNIINPQLTNIKIDKLENGGSPTITIPEGTGVYLYDAINYGTTNVDPLRVTETKANFTDDNFNNRAKSIKIVNPTSDFKFGAILFAKNSATNSNSGYDLRGNCAFALDSIPDLNSANGQQNNPPIGQDNLSSILVFKTKDGSPSVTLYNSIDCKKGTDEFEKQLDANDICTISSGSNFRSLSEACPNFKGNIVSIKTSGDVGILFKTADGGTAGRCQFFESNNTGCINTVKHSYVYFFNRDLYEPSVTPKSFIVFPLVK